jgi:hypothetical protein
MAWTATRSHGAPAMPAAMNTVPHTGGVMVDSSANQNTNRCAASNGTPNCCKRRPCHRDADDVGCRGRHFHAEDQAGKRRQQQGSRQPPARKVYDQRSDLHPQSGLAQNPDDDRSAQDDGRNHGDLLPCGDDGRRKTLPDLLHGRDAGSVEKQQDSSGENGQRRSILRGKPANEQPLHQHRKRHHERTGQ